MPSTFTKILNNELPGSIVYKDDIVFAFLDIHPINQGHVLVVPIAEIARLGDLNDNTASHMFNVARTIASALRASSIPCQGVNLLLSDGEAAGQEVDHVHLHVIPRMKDDGIGFNATHNTPSRAVLETTAEMIRLALA